MIRQPNAQDAIDAYMTAAEWLYEEQPVGPRTSGVEETEPGAFSIPDAYAVCTYNEDAQEWVVQFPDERVVKLRDSDGELAVVTE